MNSSIKNDFDILYIKKYQVFSNGIVVLVEKNAKKFVKLKMNLIKKLKNVVVNIFAKIINVCNKINIIPYN